MATKWDTALEGARGLPCPALIGSMRVSPPRGLPDRIRRSAPWQNVINGRVAAAGHRPTDTTLPSCGLCLRGPTFPNGARTAASPTFCPWAGLGLRLGRLRLRSELQESLDACARTVSLARELQGAHDCESHAPAGEPLCVHVGRCGKPLGARLDRLEIIRLPEDQVDCVESGIAEAGCGIDRDEAALGATVEDVAGRQVTM